MPVGYANRIRSYLCRQVEEARRAGETTIAFRAGDVHNALRLTGRQPNVCQVLKGKKFHAAAGVEFVRYVYRTPSGQGANVKIEYRILPRPDAYVASNGARLWTTASGHGTPMLMFNGGPGCDDYLGPVAGMIDDLCRVIRFEPRGCGRSDWDGNYDIDTLLTDAERVREAYGVDECIVAGHSFGPSVALAYALRHPTRVLGLIGIAGGNVLNDRTWSAAYRKGLKQVGEGMGGHVFKADPKVNPEGNGSWREYVRRPSLFRDIADLDVPAVFIDAAEDIRPNWPTMQLAELMPGGRYLEIPGAAHAIWRTHAAELRQELRRAVRDMTNDAE